jgi:hypothetical protein
MTAEGFPAGPVFDWRLALHFSSVDCNLSQPGRHCDRNSSVLQRLPLQHPEHVAAALERERLKPKESARRPNHPSLTALNQNLCFPISKPGEPDVTNCHTPDLG